MAYYYGGGGGLTVARAKEHVEELVTTLQQNVKRECNFVVTEVVKGGSLGQGTAVPGDFDLDLVLFSQEIDPYKMAENRHGVKSVLDILETFLIGHFGGQCTGLTKTEHAICFKFHGEIDVDLLPSPYWGRKQEFHAFLDRLSPPQRRKFSCAASKWEIQFFQDQPPEIKEYIKRAKKWKNDKWPKSQTTNGRPKSILISVLMVAAYRRCHSPRPQDMTQQFKILVKTHASLCINLVPGDVAQHRTPYIMDPANPYNNLYESGIGRYIAGSAEGTYEPGDGNWTMFVQYIDTLDLTRVV